MHQNAQQPAQPQTGEHKRSAGLLHTKGPRDGSAGAAQHAQQGTGNEPPKKRRKKHRDLAAFDPQGAPDPAADTVDQAEGHAAVAAPAPGQKTKKGKEKQDPQGPAAVQADVPTHAAPINLPAPEPTPQKRKKKREKRQEQAEGADLVALNAAGQDQPAEGGSKAARQSPPHRKHKRRKQSDVAELLSSAEADGNHASETQPAVAPEMLRTPKKHKQRHSV